VTYEYLCKACEKEWTVEQKISESPIRTCPHCGEDKAQRLISGGTGVVFKGTGWFKNGGY
jgi:putative FmdB family regulatory protein